MQLFRPTISLLILTCSFAVAVGAQGKKAKASTIKAKEKTCQSNSLSFPCPRGLQVKSDGKTNDGIFVAYSAADKYGVFAFSPDKALNEENLTGRALKNALQNLYSTKLEDYLWKDSNDFTVDGTFSKYETGKFAKAGFNKNHGHVVHLQYVRLSYKQKDIIAGFVYELEKGGGAQKFFNDWYGGGNGTVTDALQELIVKITGEKKNTETPGGPPPPAAMAKSN